MLKYFHFLWLYFILVPSYAQKKDFVIFNSAIKAQIFYDPQGAKLDSISAQLLANDIEFVAGFRPQVSSDLSNAKGNVIVIGSEQSAMIRKLVNANQNLQGKWECYSLKVLEKPLPNIDKALIISGSDKRGTAYGVFDISEKIGVSPWYWWADVKPQKKSEVIIEQKDFVSSTPSVKYRGISLNDEDWGLQPWAAKTFEPEVGDIGPKTYTKIFELLLRLKANLIWPAMHPCTKAFFTYPGNIKAAEDFGIVIGTSHAEPMLRNNVGEWDEKTMGHFNYISNKSTVYDYWQKRVRESMGLEAIYTMGMRGVHDSGMEGVKSKTEAVKALETIISDQRNLLQKEITPKIMTIPQAFTAYKEVLEVYDNGLKLPEDITIVWPDDNYGYIQRLGNTQEQQRVGGTGVYYHASYWGRPHDYLWLSSTHPKLIWEEMHKAFSQNAKNIWVINVGDIKPLEYNTDLFLSMAYNMEVFKEQQSVDRHMEEWFAEKLGSSSAKEVAGIFQRYYQLAFERRPEFMGWSQTEPSTPTRLTEFNHFFYGDEAQKRVDRYDGLEKEVKKLRKHILPSQMDIFYELVYYPIVSASLINKKFLYQDKSYWYEKQKRLSAKDYVDLSLQAYDEMVRETDYFNNELSDGKWKHMMSMAPRELPVFNKPSQPVFKESTEDSFGLMPEGFVTVDSSLSNTKRTGFSLPDFAPSGPTAYFIDLFLQNSNSIEWTAFSNESWIKLSRNKGNLTPEAGKNQLRLWVSVDWKKIPAGGQSEGKIVVKGKGKSIEVKVKALSDMQKELGGFNGFLENNGYVSIWAANYSNKTDKETAWKELDGLGYSGKYLYTPYANPSKIDTTQILTASPSLSYDFYSFTEAIPTLNIHSLPTHPLNNSFSLRYAVAIDDQPLQIVDSRTFGRSEEWKQNVLANSTHKQIQGNFLKKGKHTLRVYMIDPGVFLDRFTIDLGGLKKAYGLIKETKTNSDF